MDNRKLAKEFASLLTWAHTLAWIGMVLLSYYLTNQWIEEGRWLYKTGIFFATFFAGSTIYTLVMGFVCTIVAINQNLEEMKQKMDQALGTTPKPD